MTKLELNKRCAAAMGFKSNVSASGEDVLFVSDAPCQWVKYDPLHYDEQAMALVKQFRLSISSPGNEGGWWGVTNVWRANPPNESSLNSDLNRAIVECVAKSTEEKK